MMLYWFNLAGLCLDFLGFAGVAALAFFDARDLEADRAYLARKGTIEERVDYMESPALRARIKRATRRARLWIAAAAITAFGYAAQVVAATGSG